MGQLGENSVPSGDCKRRPTMSKHCAERYSHNPSQEPDTHFADGETKDQSLSCLPRPHGQVPLLLGCEKRQGPQNPLWAPPGGPHDDRPCSLMMVMLTRRRPRVAVPTGTSMASTSSCFSSSSSGRINRGTRTSTSSTPSWNSTMPRASGGEPSDGGQGAATGVGGEGGARGACPPTLVCSERVIAGGHLELMEGPLLHVLLCQLQQGLLGRAGSHQHGVHNGVVLSGGGAGGEVSQAGREAATDPRPPSCLSSLHQAQDSRQQKAVSSEPDRCRGPGWPHRRPLQPQGPEL